MKTVRFLEPNTKVKGLILALIWNKKAGKEQYSYDHKTKTIISESGAGVYASAKEIKRMIADEGICPTCLLQFWQGLSDKEIKELLGGEVKC